MYGLSETTGTTTINHYNDFSLEHAGKTMVGAHLKISDPDEEGQGEIVVKGRHIMMGYFKNEEATRECIDQDGYFKTGDQGRIDEGGFIKITGRIKELIITAGGENIAPVPIEDCFKGICPECSNIMLIGENRRFIAALITFKVEVDMEKFMPSTILEPEIARYFKLLCGITIKTSEEACDNQKIKEYIKKCINETNQKSVSKAAHIKEFRLIPMDFSHPGGELTPTMKLKRKVTEAKFGDIVDGIYNTAKM